MIDLLDKGQDAISPAGRKALAAYEAAIDAGRGSDAVKALDTARNELVHPKMPATFERFRMGIERLAKEKGQLPDEDTVAKIASAAGMRDPWSMALKYEIIDAEVGDYKLKSAGPDRSYGTDDDAYLECRRGE
jgi:hypothetical protein